MRFKIIFLFAFITFSQLSTNAQCSLCTKTAAGLDDKSAKGLNGGIIYLALMPLGIISLLGIRWYKSYKNTI